MVPCDIQNHSDNWRYALQFLSEPAKTRKFTDYRVRLIPNAVQLLNYFLGGSLTRRIWEATLFYCCRSARPTVLPKRLQLPCGGVKTRQEPSSPDDQRCSTTSETHATKVSRHHKGRRRNISSRRSLRPSTPSLSRECVGIQAKEAELLVNQPPLSTSCSVCRPKYEH